jgi:hypothetical protein
MIQTRRMITWLFSITLFVSAWLLFAVQPLLGKLMLPLVGGSPSGWLTALAFFQLALLAGYLGAHLLSRLNARAQVWATVVVLLLGAVFLPPEFKPEADQPVGNVGAVLLLLLRAIVVPYIGLAMVSSGLQRLYAARLDGARLDGAGGGDQADPYFLYAASNIGSFVGLLSYPLLVEPLLPLSAQQNIWAAGYALLLALLVVVAWPQLRVSAQSGVAAVAPIAAPTVGWGQRGRWVLLAFIPSSLSMGLTALVMADIGSMPLLWVIPLGLYLLTFVIAFKAGKGINLPRLATAQIVCTAIQLIFYIGNRGSYAPEWIYVLVPLALFWFSALWCHGELARLRPAPAALTEYYLWLAVGGALGGNFNAFVAPLLFSYPLEFMLTAALALCLQPWRRGVTFPVFVGAGLALLLLAGSALYIAPSVAKTWLQVSLPLLLFTPVALTYFPRWLGVAALAAVMLLQVGAVHPQRLFIGRNFFGVAEVLQVKDDAGDTWRYYRHGRGSHGAQLIANGTGSIEELGYITMMKWLALKAKFTNVGILGSGVAMGVCLGGSQQHSTIYEIDPLARHIAENWFSYIKSCGTPEWRMGDGRLELARDQAARYDLLIIDAFAGGFIPAHLLTREAMAVYVSRLQSGGVIAVNTNNLSFYNINLPVIALGQDVGLQIWQYHHAGKWARGDMGQSNWVMLAQPSVDLGYLQEFGFQRVTQPIDFPVWRDDFTNPLAALKGLHHAETP